MTIKTISRGVNPKTIPWRGTCYNCKTVVECAKSDATYHSNYDPRDPRDGDYYTVPCTVCAGQIRVREYHAHDGRGPG